MAAGLLLVFALIPLIGDSRPAPVLPPTCDSIIYCQGRLLHDVQMMNATNGESKRFVDMKLRFNESVVMAMYEESLKNKWNGHPNHTELEEFINHTFVNKSGLQMWTPLDYKARPALVERISDKVYQDLILRINNITLNLSRKVDDDVRVNHHLYSLLYVPNGFIIPGGRFGELYYWDSYWIVNGLLLCDMVDTARGVIDNFFYLFKRHGIIPNGNRKYYLGRSQPPLLTPMVHDLLNQSSSRQNLELVKDNLHVLDSEFEFWMTNRTVTVWRGGAPYRLARYYSPSAGPRPESYREDVNTTAHLQTEREKNELYSRLKSATESGMDFSSRWFIAANGTSQGILADTDTPNIVPADLNAFLHNNAKILSGLHSRFNNTKKVKYYEEQAKRLLKAIDAVLWNEKDGIWYDYDLKNKKPRAEFFASNLVPLWTRSYQEESVTRVSERVLNYIEIENSNVFRGGVPSTFNQLTGQQWDFPNTWPPVLAMVVQGLERLGTPWAKLRAKQLAKKWLSFTVKSYNEHNFTMFEKYTVTGRRAGQGEYTVQDGFGWTNGVALQLLAAYPDLPFDDEYNGPDLDI